MVSIVEIMKSKTTNRRGERQMTSASEFKIVNKSTADTDYTIGYLGGKPVAICQEDETGGWFNYVPLRS